jgi:hypothetical protein
MRRSIWAGAAVAVLVAGVVLAGCARKNAAGPQGEGKPTFVSGGTGQPAKAGPAGKAVAPGGQPATAGKEAPQ